MLVRMVGLVLSMLTSTDPSIIALIIVMSSSGVSTYLSFGCCVCLCCVHPKGPVNST